MHILYLHQHFALPSGSTGTRSYEFAKRWVKQGHKVTVITGYSVISGMDFSQKEQDIEGIKVVIAGMRYANKMGFLKRVWAFMSFVIYAFFAGLKVKDVDVIFATSTPLTIGIPGMWLKWIKKVPMVFEVRDEWPRIPIDMGYIKNKLMIKFLYRLEKKNYLRSSAIVALSPGMAEGVRERLGNVERKIVVASNSSDLERFRPDIDGSEIREKLNWGDKFVLLHFGTMGKANGLDFLIDVAEKLVSIDDVKIVLIGSGSEKNRLIEDVKQRGLNNIDILDSIPKDKLPMYVSAADVSMVVFENYPIFEHNSANKFYDSLSAGKPILLNYSGWHRELIENAGCGFGVKQGDIDSFCANVKKIYDSRENLAECCRKARMLAENEFARDIISTRVLEAITTSVK